MDEEEAEISPAETPKGRGVKSPICRANGFSPRIGPTKRSASGGTLSAPRPQWTPAAPPPPSIGLSPSACGWLALREAARSRPAAKEGASPFAVSFSSLQLSRPPAKPEASLRCGAIHDHSEYVPEDYIVAVWQVRHRRGCRTPSRGANARVSPSMCRTGRVPYTTAQCPDVPWARRYGTARVPRTNADGSKHCPTVTPYSQAPASAAPVFCPGFDGRKGSIPWSTRRCRAPSSLCREGKGLLSIEARRRGRGEED
jgi:hypothetical protein